MELFKQLRHLYVNVGNDVRHLQETASRPRIGLPRQQADKLFNEPHSDVKLQEEKVRAKIKELQDETHFGEVVTCCFDVLNHSLAQLGQVEQHLQKYSVQPIGNARQQCEIQPSVSSKENELPSAICNPVSTAVPMVTEPCKPQAKEWPTTYNIARTPKLSDFGISESFTQRLDEVTAAILKRSHISHAIAGQDQTGNGVFNSATDPCLAQPSCHSSPTATDTASQNRQLDLSAIRGHGQNQGDVLSKKPVGKSVLKANLDYEQSNLIQSMNALAVIDDENNFSSTLPFPLHGTSLPHTGVGLPGYNVPSGRLECSSKAKSTLMALDLPMPSPPQLSEMAKKALDFRVVAKDRSSILPHSVKKEMDLSPSDSTSLLSEQTVNILRQLQLSKIPSSGIKLEPYSAEKIGENVPPDHLSTWKSNAVNTGHTAAKRCLDLGEGVKTRDTASGHVFSQNVVSTTEFVPKSRTAAGVTVTDQISNVKRSSAKSHPCVTETSSVRGHGDGTNSKCGTDKSSGSGFGSEDWTCPQIRSFSVDDYENLVPATVKSIVTLERINDCIGKANDVLLNKMLDGSSIMLSVDDLKHAVGSNASLFLKLMAKTGRLSEKTGERGLAEYNLI